MWSYDRESFKFLLDLGANIGAQDENQHTALHLAIIYWIPEVPKVPKVPEDSERISLLLAKRASVNVLSDKFDTPLHAACTSHEFRRSPSNSDIETLFDHGADSNVRTGSMPQRYRLCATLDYAMDAICPQW